MGSKVNICGFESYFYNVLIISYKKLTKFNKVGNFSFFFYKMGIIIALVIILFYN